MPIFYHAHIDSHFSFAVFNEPVRNVFCSDSCGRVGPRYSLLYFTTMRKHVSVPWYYTHIASLQQPSQQIHGFSVPKFASPAPRFVDAIYWMTARTFLCRGYNKGALCIIFEWQRVGSDLMRDVGKVSSRE